KRGTPNRVTADVRELARHYTLDAVRGLAKIAMHGRNEGARVAAIARLLAYGWGQPPQAIDHQNSDDSLRPMVLQVFSGIARLPAAPPLDDVTPAAALRLPAPDNLEPQATEESVTGSDTPEALPRSRE